MAEAKRKHRSAAERLAEKKASMEKLQADIAKLQKQADDEKRNAMLKILDKNGIDTESKLHAIFKVEKFMSEHNIRNISDLAELIKLAQRVEPNVLERLGKDREAQRTAPATASEGYPQAGNHSAL